MALHSLHLLSCTKHSISVLRSSKLVILCIEALIWLALQKSSNTWKSVFCIANNISWERSIFHILELYSLKLHLANCLSLRKKLFSIRGRARALLLKLHFATFSHWERSFSASMALHSLNLLSCNKHSIMFLEALNYWFCGIEALTWLALQKSSNTWNLSFCIANNISFHEKETSLI